MRHRTFLATCSVGSTKAQLLSFLSDPSTPWHKYFTGGGTNISEAFHYPHGQHKPTRTLSLPHPPKNNKKLCWETGVAQDQVFAPFLQVHSNEFTRLLNPVWANVRNASKIF